MRICLHLGHGASLESQDFLEWFDQSRSHSACLQRPDGFWVSLGGSGAGRYHFQSESTSLGKEEGISGTA
jgi:hypothetical protein